MAHCCYSLFHWKGNLMEVLQALPEVTTAKDIHAGSLVPFHLEGTTGDAMKEGTKSGSCSKSLLERCQTQTWNPEAVFLKEGKSSFLQTKAVTYPEAGEKIP